MILREVFGDQDILKLFGASILLLVSLYLILKILQNFGLCCLKFAFSRTSYGFIFVDVFPGLVVIDGIDLVLLAVSMNPIVFT